MYSADAGQGTPSSVITVRPTVICQRADHLHHKTAAPHGLRPTADTEVGVLPQEPVVLLVDANDVLDNKGRAIVLYETTGLVAYV